MQSSGGRTAHEERPAGSRQGSGEGSRARGRALVAAALAFAVFGGCGQDSEGGPDKGELLAPTLPPEGTAEPRPGPAAGPTETDASSDGAVTPDAGGPTTIAGRCFPHMQKLPVPAPSYDALGPVVGSHCLGTNHQAITGIQRVVFLGDSVTVGVPNLSISLASFGLPAGAGTSETAFYRNKLADALAVRFGLPAPGPLWRLVDITNGVALQRSSGPFSSCAKWGARTDDILLDPQRQLETCIPPADRGLKTLIVMTVGGNDLDSLTQSALKGATRPQLEAQATKIANYLDDAIAWIKSPGRFPNGVSVIFGNMYEFTDGTGDTSSCPAAQLAGFGAPPPDPITLSDVVYRMQERLMKIAVKYGVDMIWMLEHFCGHGWRKDDPTSACYRGPGAERYFDLSCTHPSVAGHQKLVEMFTAVVDE